MHRGWLIVLSALQSTAPILLFPQAEQDETQATEMMDQMQAKMRAMQEQMARIQSTEDPEERQRLIWEHMQSMQKTMGMMLQMMEGSESTAHEGWVGR